MGVILPAARTACQQAGGLRWQAMDLLVEFLRHNSMMNGRLLDTCRQLNPEQLGATATGTYGTVGATLVHIADAQLGYASRLLEVERPQMLLADEFPGFDLLA